MFWPRGLRLILAIAAGDNWERQGVKTAVYLFDTGSYFSDSFVTVHFVSCVKLWLETLLLTSTLLRHFPFHDRNMTFSREKDVCFF